jgi:O-antigen/teichoic acid export membrane protein
MNSLKKQTINGAKWKLIENISVYGLRFILGLILARLLLPSDYGIIGLIAVFLAVAEIFINSGFGSALIQRKDRTDVDYSTVFYFNILISIICWIILFLTRNIIADFFDEPLLAKIIPILGVNLIINAFGSIQQIRLMIELNFKSQTLASTISIIIAGIIAANDGNVEKAIPFILLVFLLAGLFQICLGIEN